MTHIPLSIRELVRVRAEFRCEYCRLPEGYSFYSHQVDHIRAVKHRGTSNPDNLAWACFDCNNAKGSNIASFDEDTDQLTPLYNPRTGNWAEHFRLDGVEIVGKTSVGRVTVFILKMNSEEQLQARQNLIDAGMW